jgi:GDP-L-galactose phosphorylase
MSDWLLQVRGVHIERLQGYPVPGWVFSGSDNIDSLAALVGTACMQLSALGVPHNLLLCDAGSRVIVWPQRFAERQAHSEVPPDVLATCVNPAAFEIAGHMVLKRREDYEGLTEARAWELLKHVGLRDSDFDEVEEKIFAAYMLAL